MNKPINSINSELNIPDTFRRYNAYFKKGNCEYYCQDFAYSAIYGNLNLDKLDDILCLLKLEYPPTILFLVRVDEFNDIYNDFPKFDKYPIKAKILNQIERSLRNKNIKGVVASYLGRDTIGVFLCIHGQSIKDEKSRLYLKNLAELLIREVKERAQRSISIGISDFCKDIRDFPIAYHQCQEAFKNNFCKGKGTYMFYDEKEDVFKTLNKNEIYNYRFMIISNLDGLSIHKCKETIHDMMDFLYSSNVSSIDIRMYMVKLVDYISNYYLEQGVQKEDMDLISLNAMKDILNSSFLSTIEKTIEHFCESIYENIKILHRSLDDKIKQFTKKCIETHYSNANFNLSMISQLCNYSTYYFGRLFKDLFGVTFNQYLRNYRIEKSKRYILYSELSIEDIAFKVGFSSVSYYCTTFKKITGVTPSRYKGNLYQIKSYTPDDV